jgi:2-methylaconitate cis-trans-isomerase PrpF
MNYTGRVVLANEVKEESAVADKSVRSDGKTRVQFDLPARSMSLLTELKEKTDASSYAEVFKNALKLYDGLVTEVERGGEFLLRSPDGTVSTFKMFF